MPAQPPTQPPTRSHAFWGDWRILELFPGRMLPSISPGWELSRIFTATTCCNNRPMVQMKKLRSGEVKQPG